jgi:hypothetical protein
MPFVASVDFKLGTIDNRKDYLQTWGEFFFFHFFLIKTGKRDFLLDIYFKLRCVYHLSIMKTNKYPCYILMLI